MLSEAVCAAQPELTWRQPRRLCDRKALRVKSLLLTFAHLRLAKSASVPRALRILISRCVQWFKPFNPSIRAFARYSG
jgi:hypothetical protein